MNRGFGENGKKLKCNVVNLGVMVGFGQEEVEVAYMNQVFEVDRCGLACLMIRPNFDIFLVQEVNQPQLGQDGVLCGRVQVVLIFLGLFMEEVCCGGLGGCRCWSGVLVRYGVWEVVVLIVLMRFVIDAE